MTSSTIQPLTLDWTETETHLRYSLSDYSLFSLRLVGRTYAVPIAPLLPATFKADLEEFLRSAPGNVPLLCIRNLPIEQHVPRLQSVGGRLQYTLNQCYQYYADLGGNFDQYLASLSTKTRSTLKRKIKKFASLSGGNVDWRVYTAADQMPEYHRLAREVAAKTYQERLFNGAIPGDERFRAQISNLAAANLIRGYLLFLNGAPIAYLHLPIQDGVVEYAYLGYDPAHAEVSPGSVLLYSALQDLFAAQQFSYFDFSYGTGQTKEVFSTAKYLRADVFYFATSLKHYVAAYSHMALDSTSSMLGRTLERINLHTAVKRLLRRTRAAA